MVSPPGGGSAGWCVRQVVDPPVMSAPVMNPPVVNPPVTELCNANKLLANNHHPEKKMAQIHNDFSKKVKMICLKRGYEVALK